MIRWSIRTQEARAEPMIDVKGMARKAVKAGTRAGKKAVRPGVKARYTYKGAVGNAVNAKVSGLTGTITVRDSRKSLTQFNLRKPTRKRYAYATVVRGQGGSLRKAFLLRGALFERVGKARLPIRKLKTVATAQMAGHKVVSKYIENAIEQAIEVELGAM